MEETYKPIPNYEGLYEVSNLGNVKSLPKATVNRFNGKTTILSQMTNKNGYKKLTLCKDKKHFNKMVHRLVADAFIPNPENKKCVNHIDSNRTNNNLSNLEWVTYGENMQHALKSGSFKNQPKGEDHCCNKLSFNAIKLIRCLKNKALNETIARLFNVSHSHISNILNDKSRIHC